jgi:hypothetical protein
MIFSNVVFLHTFLYVGSRPQTHPSLGAHRDIDYNYETYVTVLLCRAVGITYRVTDHVPPNHQLIPTVG